MLHLDAEQLNKNGDSKGSEVKLIELRNAAPTLAKHRQKPSVNKNENAPEGSKTRMVKNSI